MRYHSGQGIESGWPRRKRGVHLLGCSTIINALHVALALVSWGFFQRIAHIRGQLIENKGDLTQQAVSHESPWVTKCSLHASSVWELVNLSQLCLTQDVIYIKFAASLLVSWPALRSYAVLRGPTFLVDSWQIFPASQEETYPLAGDLLSWPS